jgi:hypothetical protein
VHSYNNVDDRYGIVQRDDGSIYVAGLRDLVATGYDFLVISLFAQGDTNWTFSVSGTDWWESAYDIVYRLDGNIHTPGEMSGGLWWQAFQQQAIAIGSINCWILLDRERTAGFTRPEV